MRIKKKISRFFTSEFVDSGHYFSVIPSLEEIQSKESELFNKMEELVDVEIDKNDQINIATRFSLLKESTPFYSKSKRIRFEIDNYTFSYDDAPVLHYMMRDLRPKRIIEIGCGYSSACILDTSELFLASNVECTFIDIDFTTLRKLLLEKDYSNITMIEQPIQKVDLSIFEVLEENDILFIDSSHVSKLGSDLHTIIFKILPILKKGVCIHFHDIRYPFQYHKDLVYKKIFWNEAYLLRAFLQNNDSFKVYFWLNYLLNQKDIIERHLLNFLPLDEWDSRFNRNQNDYSNAGGSIYIKKVK